MIIKLILDKLNFHIFFYIASIIFIITGYFYNYVIFFSLILIHELGHVLVAYIFKWNIKSIKILPFGGVVIFNELINKPLKEEFLIIIAGPIFQLLASFAIYYITKDTLVFTYSNLLFMFNLLPIYPLDGSRVLNIVFNVLMPFKLSFKLSIYISYLIIMMFIFIDFNLFIILTLLSLLYTLIKEHRNIKNIFNKFLFERYLYKFNFKKTKIINNKEFDMKRDYKHLFLIENKYVTEKEILRKKFDL